MVKADSLRKKVYEEWIKNPYIVAKELCLKHGLVYEQHGNYVNRLLSEFRSYCNFGSPQEAHLPEHRVFEWEGVVRVYEGDREMPLFVWEAGWRVVRDNRNDVWAFKDSQGRGSVHWYGGGLVRLYLKGELQVARAKELFCRAFSWFSPQELRKYLDVPLVEKYKKWTFEMSKIMPRFDIRQFERSHGLRIFTDGSHPTSLHVGESTFELKELIDEQKQATVDQREMMSDFGEVIQKFGVEIQEHMKLIRLWQREAKHVRSTQLPVIKSIKVKPNQKSLFEWIRR